MVMEELFMVIYGFNHRVAIRIAGNTARRDEEDGWEFPPVEESLDLAGMWLIKK